MFNNLNYYECTYNEKTFTVLAANEKIARLFASSSIWSTTWSSKNADKVIVKELK